MRCPFCHANDDKVIDSRSTEAGKVIRRRRQCVQCSRRFTTYEHVEHTRLAVIKKDGSRVPFDRDKIMAGLQKACYKRPIDAEQLSALVDAVEEELFSRFDKEVASLVVGRAVIEKLRGVDQVAYVRYASVYKQFRDIGDLLDEVRDMVASTDPPQPPDQGRLF